TWPPRNVRVMLWRAGAFRQPPISLPRRRMPRNTYGGQALIEGVMIRGAGSMSVACRRPNGQIVIRTQNLAGVPSHGSGQVPLVRGVIALWATLVLGMRALSFSAAVSRESVDAEDETGELPATVAWSAILGATGFAAALFFATPILLAQGLHGAGVGRLGTAIVEGVFRFALFLGYVVLIGCIPGIRRVFQYHGAEHMAVHAHEAGAPLTPAGVRSYPKEHPRCGTSFLLVVMSLAVVTFVGFDLIAHEGLIARVASRVMMIPLIAAVSYELIRL